jgi:enediyne biosynthesis protein E4
MITGAIWQDVTGDKQKELIIVGEWIAPRIFSFNKDHFDEIKTNISNEFGWWQSVTAADVNNDGKTDLILGNIGENFYLCPKADAPVKLWVNDFDNNGGVDKIITYTIDGKDKPVFLKSEVQDQLPFIKKENLHHREYAVKAMQDLFPKQLVKTSLVKNFTNPSSCVAINNGNGNFTLVKLPLMSQMSCINAIIPVDVNNDGFVDLVTGGNQFGFLPQFEKLDASFGDVLINDGKGNFTWQQDKKCGISLRGEVRDIALLKNKNETRLLFLRNNDFPALYKLNNPLQKK